MHSIEDADQFIYPDIDGVTELDVGKRIKTIISASTVLSKILKCSYLNNNFKLELFLANVLSVLLY